MGSLSGLGIGLSFLFGCFLFGLVAELYYLLWWKKRYPNRSLQNPQPTKNPQDFSLQFCCNPLNAAKGIKTKHELPIIFGNGHDQDLELRGEEAKEFVHKNHGESESIESELMRLHNLSGPPRFLFTIVEETKEDLECEEKSRNTRSLGEFFLKSVDSPYLTPMASPNINIQSFDSGNQFGFNPLYESSTDWEISRLKASPPPKFKFLRDAEEKLLKKLMESAGETKCQSNGDLMIQDYGVCPQEKDKTFVRIVVEKSKEKEIHQQLAHYNHSTASQVLPLTMSPSEYRPHDQDFYRN